MFPMFPQKKVILLGDGGVGKTTFVKRYLEHKFEPRYIATIGVEVRPFIATSKLSMSNGILEDKNDLWECGSSYIDCDAVIIMFDLTAKITFRHIENWYNDIPNRTSIPIVIVGNKNDIGKRKVFINEIDKFIESKPNKHIVYCDISVKTGSGCDELIDWLEDKLT